MRLYRKIINYKAGINKRKHHKIRDIDLGGFDLTIVADSFINQASANISAERLNLYSVNSFLNEGVIDATIDQY